MESLAPALPHPRLGLRAAALHPATVAMVTLSCAAAAAFAWLALLHYASFQSTAFDLGFFDQVVWQISRGHPGLTSYLYYYDFFGQHVEPVLYVFGALYRLWADPRLLLIAQALAVGAAALVLYRCSCQVARPWPSLAISAAFLLSVPLHNALAFDFHPEVMSCLPLFVGLWFALKGRPWGAAACWGSLLLFKEDESLILPALGLLLLLIGGSTGSWRRRVAPSLVLAIGGVAWAILATGVIEPHWRHGYAGDLTQDYAAFGGSLGAALTTIARRPIDVAGLVFGQGGFAALLHWLAGDGLAPVLAPLGLLAAMPELLLQLASQHQAQHVLRLHYGVEAVPLVFAFLVLELRWLRGRPRQAAGLAFSAGGLAVAAFILGSPFAQAPAYAPLPTQRLEAIEQVMRLIPPDATLRASSTLAAHLSQRERIQEFPGSDWGEYVALDTRAPAEQSNAQEYDAARSALAAQGYTKIYDREGVQVWKR